jgi:formylglycine-generating enzyme required for sulfatase activity
MERFVTKKVLLAFLLLGVLSAAAKDLHNLGRDGVAIQGYDPVAFFTDHQPVKGGSWASYAHHATIRFGNMLPRDSRLDEVGFRPLLEP